MAVNNAHIVERAVAFASDVARYKGPPPPLNANFHMYIAACKRARVPESDMHYILGIQLALSTTDSDRDFVAKAIRRVADLVEYYTSFVVISEMLRANYSGKLHKWFPMLRLTSSWTLVGGLIDNHLIGVYINNIGGSPDAFADFIGRTLSEYLDDNMGPFKGNVRAWLTGCVRHNRMAEVAALRYAREKAESLMPMDVDAKAQSLADAEAEAEVEAEVEAKAEGTTAIRSALRKNPMLRSTVARAIKVMAAILYFEGHGAPCFA